MSGQCQPVRWAFTKTISTIVSLIPGEPRCRNILVLSQVQIIV